MFWSGILCGALYMIRIFSAENAPVVSSILYLHSTLICCIAVSTGIFTDAKGCLSMPTAHSLSGIYVPEPVAKAGEGHYAAGGGRGKKALN